MSKLILIRGLPGSGKSTFAKYLQDKDENLVHFEADMFFEADETGEYVFRPERLPNAHEWCKNMTAAALEIGQDVVVSNTFTQKWEIDPYAQIANQYGAELVIIKMETQFQSIHGVPEKKIEQMKRRWEEWE